MPTPRESDVLAELLLGNSCPEIARRLHMSRGGVEKYLQRMRQRHDVPTTLALAVKVLTEQRDEARRDLMECLTDLAHLDRRRVRR